MKNKFRFLLLLLLPLFVFTACSSGGITANYKSFSFQKQSESALIFDITIDFKNTSKQDSHILMQDVYIEVNEVVITSNTFYLGSTAVLGNVSISAKTESTVIIKSISAFNNKANNKIIMKYKNSVLIEDTVYISF